jgi:Tfp pilus assembly protein PilN
MFGTFLGIEFKEDSIVLTYLNNSLSGVSVLSSSTFVLRDHETTANEIREYIDQHGTEINKVFVSITDKWAITKFIDIPSMKGKGKNAIANLMRFEIERHIPFEIEEVAYDFLVVDEVDSRCSTVFVVAQKTKIEFIKDFLERLSLVPNTITLSSFAVLNTVELSGVSVGGWQDILGIVRKSDMLGNRGETNVCLNFDRMYASLAVIRDGFCINMKALIMSSSQSFEEFVKDIVNHLAFKVQHISKLIITGDVTTMPGITDTLEAALKEKEGTVERIVKFAGDLRGVKMNGLSSSVGACFAGLGIGTYKINLLPHKGDYEIKKLAPLATKVFIILAIILTIGIFASDAVKHKNALQIMDETLEKNKPVVDNIQDLSSDIRSLKQRSDFLHNIRDNEITLEILAELANVIPKDAWITNLHFKGFEIENKKREGGELVISGYAASSSILIPLLEDSLLFEKVEFVGPIKKTKGKEKFKLSAKLIKPVAPGGEKEETAGDNVQNNGEEQK